MKTYLKSLSQFLILCVAGNLWLGCEKENQSVLTGLDVLEKNNFDKLRGKRVGLITNQTGLNKDGIQNVDLFFNAGIDLKAVFSPEHGFSGKVKAGEKIESTMDKKSGLSIFSLYGKTRRPTGTMLHGLDILVFDIQDIGLRSYTYMSTMGLAMEAAGKYNLEIVVLDRPNPMSGIYQEGRLLDEQFKSFIGMYPIPYVHGLTPGELATLINENHWVGEQCNLSVIPLSNWDRKHTWDQTGLMWIAPSPNVPKPTTPYFMAATGIFGELGVFSVGIGTEFPFEFLGAPWIDAETITQKMNSLQLDGLSFEASTVTPTKGLYQGQNIHGIRIHIHENSTPNLIPVQFHFMSIHHEMYPEKNPFTHASKNQIAMFDKALGTDTIRKQFQIDFNLKNIESILCPDLGNFSTDIKPLLLYE